MNRCVVNVATGRYVGGQIRLHESIGYTAFLHWSDRMPPGSPPHDEVPYAFKAHALEHARQAGWDLVLWADASIVAIRPLDPLLEKIERDGYWISDNGYLNHEWTARSAYALLGVTPD